MAEFNVNTDELHSFGENWERYGNDNVPQTGKHTRDHCGRTDDMEGLLGIISPALGEVAKLFGDHYDDVAKVIAGTGTALMKTADDYAALDKDQAAALDAGAVAAGDQTDTAMSGKVVSWSETYATGQDYKADKDPAAEIRSNMDADVQAIDWVFEKFTGNHITAPLDELIGNWTTLTARGKSWKDTHTLLDDHSKDIDTNTKSIDEIWDGVAATSFKQYGVNLSKGLAAESEIPIAIQEALDYLAKKWEELYQEAVDEIQSVIHDVEIAAVALAAGWWCGVGEAVAAGECVDALVAFYRAYKIVKLVKHVITIVNETVKGFKELVAIFDTLTNIPEKVDAQIEKIKDLAKDIAGLPGTLEKLSHLGDTPTSPYGGPSAPNVG